MSEAQFLDLIRQHQGIIYKLVNLYAQDAEEKKDLYQEVLLNTWKGYPSFRGDAKFSTWLYRISLNTIFVHKRKAKMTNYTGSLDELTLVAQQTNTQKEESLRLQQAIRQLPEGERVIISLHLDGYEHAEIAEIVGINVNHVAVKLHRSKQQVANLLKP